MVLADLGSAEVPGVALADSDEALGAEPVALEAVPDVALEEPVD